MLSDTRKVDHGSHIDEGDFTQGLPLRHAFNSLRREESPSGPTTRLRSYRSLEEPSEEASCRYSGSSRPILPSSHFPARIFSRARQFSSESFPTEESALRFFSLVRFFLAPMTFFHRRFSFALPAARLRNTFTLPCICHSFGAPYVAPFFFSAANDKKLSIPWEPTHFAITFPSSSGPPAWLAFLFPLYITPRRSISHCTASPANFTLPYAGKMEN